MSAAGICERTASRSHSDVTSFVVSRSRIEEREHASVGASGLKPRRISGNGKNGREVSRAWYLNLG